VVRAVLSHMDFEFVEAVNAQEGLLQAREIAPDAIILDLTMPDLSGFEVLKRLKENERTASIPVIIYTSKVLAPEERSMLRQAVAILSKESKSRELSVEQFTEAFKQAGVPVSTRNSSEAQHA